MLKKFCEITSCNGVIDLYESKSSKLSFTFWACVMIAMGGLTVYFTYKTILGFVQSPTVTNVGTVANSEMELPSVLVCYLGGLNVSYMKGENLSENFTKDFTSALMVGGQNFNKSEMEFQNYLKNKNTNLSSFIGKAGFKCEDFVTGFLSNDGEIPCNRSERLLNDFGNCYLFRNNFKQYWPGKSGGFFVELKRPKNAFYESYCKEATRNGMSNGFYITLEKEFGFQTTDRNILIPMNKRVEVTLNTKRYIRQRKCDNSSEMYSSNSCFFQRYVVAIEQRIGCIPIQYWDDSLVNCTMCDPFKSLATNDDWPWFTVDTCKPKCDEWIYENTVTYIDIDVESKEESFSSVAIFYNTMQFMQIVEVEAFTIDMAVANVGGQAGLWIGASIVTIIQAIYYLILWIKEKICPKNPVHVKLLKLSSKTSLAISPLSSGSDVNVSTGYP